MVTVYSFCWHSVGDNSNTFHHGLNQDASVSYCIELWNQNNNSMKTNKTKQNIYIQASYVKGINAKKSAYKNEV